MFEYHLRSDYLWTLDFLYYDRTNGSKMKNGMGAALVLVRIIHIKYNSHYYKIGGTHVCMYFLSRTVMDKPIGSF